LDEFPFERFAALLDRLPVTLIDRGKRELDVRWDRRVAEAAVRLYAEGWVAQMRLPEGDQVARVGKLTAAYREVLARMQAEVEAQVSGQGYYVPFGPVRMIVAQKSDEGLAWNGEDECAEL
jgi:hypothetical protein